jgi:hypothetical protein
MKYKLTAAAFLHAVALACLASGDYARGLEACVDGLIARLAEKRDFPP